MLQDTCVPEYCSLLRDDEQFLYNLWKRPQELVKNPLSRSSEEKDDRRHCEEGYDYIDEVKQWECASTQY